MTTATSTTKDCLPENAEWLEDSRKERFSRYSTEPECSVWVCNECDAIDADPYDYGCTACGNEADYFQ